MIDGAARVAVRVADVARRVLAALARVRAAAEAVHRDRERLVRLARERAERHRPGDEPLDDLLRRLDLVERDAAVLREAEREQPADRPPAGAVVVDRPRVLLVRLPSALAHRVLEQRDRLRVPLVELAVAPPGVEADDRQQVVRRARVGAGVPGERLLGERLDADAADARRRAGEVPLDELGREAEDLEDLRAAVGRDRRDAHLRHRLQQTLGDALDGAALGLLRRSSPSSPRSAELARASRASGTG